MNSAAPPVLTWFKVYCAIEALLFFALSAIGAVMFVAWLVGGVTTGEDVFLAIGMAVVCLPLTIAYVAGIFLKPKPWVWIYDIVLIAFGLTSCLTIPFAVPLLIFWLKPETKAYFGRS